MPRFSITALLWLFALVAAALAAFDGWGVLAAGAVCVFWTHFQRSPRQTVFGCAWIVGGGLLLAALLLSSTARATSRYFPRNHCRNDMRQVAIALINYDDLEGSLPPSQTTAPDGTPLQSWRLLILPYVEHQGAFAAVASDKPWDSPANQLKVLTEVDTFHCEERRRPPGLPNADYFVVTGDHTLWPPGGPRSLRDVPDGAENTILLIEGPSHSPWTKPGDLTLDAAIDLLASSKVDATSGVHFVDLGYFYRRVAVRHIVMADGRFVDLRCPIDPDTARAMLTADGGEPVQLEQLDAFAESALDWRRCGGLAMFVLVSLAPAIPALRRRRRSE